MNAAHNIWKKFLSLLLAVILIFCTASFAFADEDSEGNGGVELTEDQSQTSEEESADIAAAEVDLSNLKLQVAIVNGLNEYDYTGESWDVLSKAFDEGMDLIRNGAPDQKTANEAAKVLEAAIGSLVRMDYSQLEKALSAVYSCIGENEQFYDIWSKIDEAEKKARPLLISGDQAAVDAAAKELNDLLEELEAYYAGTEAESGVVIKEVEVKVPPSEDYCNISMHGVWPVLFAVSVVLNIALAGMMAYMFMKKRNTVDDIPLVNYDIDDDFDDFDDLGDFEDIDEEDDV